MRLVVGIFDPDGLVVIDQQFQKNVRDRLSALGQRLGEIGFESLEKLELFPQCGIFGIAGTAGGRREQNAGRAKQQYPERIRYGKRQDAGSVYSSAEDSSVVPMGPPLSLQRSGA